MAKGSVTTDLLGAAVKFGLMANEDLSEQLGMIRGVYIEDGRPVYIIRILGSGRLTEATSSFFTVVQP